MIHTVNAHVRDRLIVIRTIEYIGISKFFIPFMYDIENEQTVVLCDDIYYVYINFVTYL